MSYRSLVMPIFVSSQKKMVLRLQVCDPVIADEDFVVFVHIVDYSDKEASDTS